MPHIEERDTDSGAVQLRDAVTVAFFLPMPLHEVIQGVLRAFEGYLRAVPSHALRWASIGASSEEWKPVSKTTVERCKRQLAPAAAEKAQVDVFRAGRRRNGCRRSAVWLYRCWRPMRLEFT